MLKAEIKKEISEFIQEILQDIKKETNDPELPEGEISFILHIDGKEHWSWANIRNEKDKHEQVPLVIRRNLQFGSGIRG